MTDKKPDPPCELELEDMPRPGSAFSAVSDRAPSGENCACLGQSEVSGALTFGRVDFNSAEHPNEGATIVVSGGDIAQLKGIVANPQQYAADLARHLEYLKKSHQGLQADALSADEAKAFAQRMLNQYKDQGIDVDSAAPAAPNLFRRSFTKLCINPEIG